MYILHAAPKANIFLLNLNISPASNSFRHISKILFHKCCLYVCNYCEVGIHIKLPISQGRQFCYILTFSEVGTGRVCLLLPQEPSEVMMMVLMMIDKDGAAAAYDNSDDDDGDEE